LLHLTVTNNFDLAFDTIVAHKNITDVFQYHPVAGFYGGGIAGSGLLLLHFGFETFDIGLELILTKNQFGQVQRETEGIVKAEHLPALHFFQTRGF